MVDEYETYELPDGSRYEFPVGTDLEVVRNALMKEWERKSIDAKAKAEPTIVDRANAVIRGLGRGAMFGFNDEISAGIETLLGGNLPIRNLSFDASPEYEEELSEFREREEIGRKQQPVTSFISELGGAFMPGTAMARGAIGAGRLAGNLAPRALNAPSRMAGTSLAGAAQGGAARGVSGYGTGQGVDDRVQQARDDAQVGMAIGGAIPLASQLIRKPVQQLVNSRSRRAFTRSIPEAAEIKDKASDLYDSLPTIKATKDVYKNMYDRIKNEVIDMEGVSGNTPGAQDIAQQVRKMASGKSNMTFNALSKIANRATKRGGEDGAISRKMQNILNDEIISGGRNVTGNVKEFMKIQNKASKTWAQANKVEALEKAQEATENSRGSIADIIMREAGKLSRSKSKSAPPWTEDELSAINRLSKMTSTQAKENFASKFGLNEGRNVLGPATGGVIGYGLGGPFGAAVPAVVGTVARKLLDRAKQEELKLLMAQIAKGQKPPPDKLKEYWPYIQGAMYGASTTKEEY